MSQPLTIYLDTSVISAYFDDRTPDRLDETRRFWDFAKDYQLLVSDLVIQEIQATRSPDRREEMRNLIRDLPILPLTERVALLAKDFAAENLVPPKKLDDAQHLAFALIQGADFLVSWNFRHMVNFRTVGRLPMLAAKNGYFKPLPIVTPESFRNSAIGGP